MHPVGESLDLVEDVAADDDRAAIVAEPSEQVDERDALHGVGAVERFVEDQDVGVGDQRGGDLPPLSHPLREPAEGSIGHIGQVDRGQRPLDRAVVGHAGERGLVADEVSGAERLGNGVLLGHQRDLGLHVAIRTGVVSEDRDRASSGRDEAAHRPHQGRLAGTVGTEEAGHAGAERTRQLGERDLRAEPHRHVVDDDGGVGDEGRIEGRETVGRRVVGPGAGPVTTRPTGTARATCRSRR